MSYNTAWSMKQKIMQVMKERDGSKPLSGMIQLDDAYGMVNATAAKEDAARTKMLFVAAVALNEEGSGCDEHDCDQRLSVDRNSMLGKAAFTTRQHGHF